MESEDEITAAFEKAAQLRNAGKTAEAFRIYETLAQQGHAGSQYNLGDCYERGIGTEKDFAKAVEWYRKAAEQGYEDAKESLVEFEQFEMKATLELLRKDPTAFLPPPATDEDISSNHDMLRALVIPHPIPDDYEDFLKICNGLAWKDIELHGADKHYIAEPPNNYKLESVWSLNDPFDRRARFHSFTGGDYETTLIIGSSVEYFYVWEQEDYFDENDVYHQGVYKTYRRNCSEPHKTYVSFYTFFNEEITARVAAGGNYQPAKKTYDEWLAMIRDEGYALKYVPADLITTELCLAAVQQDWEALYYVPEKFVTEEMCRTAVNQNVRALNFVPEKIKTDPVFGHSLCKTAVEEDSRTLRFVPESVKMTPSFGHALCLAGVKQHGESLEYVPEELKAAPGIGQEICHAAVSAYGNALEYVPEEQKTAPDFGQALCLIAAQYSGESLKWIPKKYITEELCMMVVRKRGWDLEYVPEEFKTKEICYVAVKRKSWAIQFVPEEMREKKKKERREKRVERREKRRMRNEE